MSELTKKTHLSHEDLGWLTPLPWAIEFKGVIRPPANINWIWRQIHEFGHSKQPRKAVADLTYMYGVELYRQDEHHIVIHMVYDSDTLSITSR